MKEKEAIERETAKAFLILYNREFGTSYKIDKCSDVPDVLCKDKTGRELKLEITLTEDREGDIPAVLGRSNSRTIDVMIEKGLEASCLPMDIQILINTIKSKLDKDYGENVALVIRHVSGIDWNWNYHIDEIRESLDLRKNNFDKGIWIINNAKTHLYKVI